MQTKEIQQQAWQQFFDDFSRQHGGKPVNIEILGPEIGAQVQESRLLLEGITAESEKDSGSSIMIMVGASANAHITHSIKRATQVSLEQSEQGDDLALAIKGVDGDMVLLHF